MKKLKESSQQIVKYLKMKTGSKYTYSAYHIYKNFGFPRGTVYILALKIRRPRLYAKRRKNFNEYQRNYKKKISTS